MLRIKTLLLSIALLGTGAAWAEWLRVAENHVLGVTVYLDTANILKIGNLRRVWEIQDLKQRHKEGYLSARYQLEYDCKEKRVKALFFGTYSGQMMAGHTMASGPSNQSGDIPSNTSAESVWKRVCAP